MKHFTTNRTLIYIAVGIASFMALTGGISRITPGVDVKEEPVIVNHIGSIDAADVAAWILEGHDDYRILDLRDPSEYEKMSLPTSENITPEEARKAEYETGKRLVIVGNNDVETRAMIELFETKGYHGALSLEGGIGAWRSQVLNPALPVLPTKSDVERYAKAMAISKYFKGETDLSDAGEAAPKITFTTPPPMIGGTKKKKEGC